MPAATLQPLTAERASCLADQSKGTRFPVLCRRIWNCENYKRGRADMQQMQQVAKYCFAQEPFSNRHTAHEKLVATREAVAPSCMMGSMARTESLFELPIFTRAAWPYMSVTLRRGINRVVMIMNTLPYPCPSISSSVTSPRKITTKRVT